MHAVNNSVTAAKTIWICSESQLEAFLGQTEVQRRNQSVLCIKTLGMCATGPHTIETWFNNSFHDMLVMRQLAVCARYGSGVRAYAKGLHAHSQ